MKSLIRERSPRSHSVWILSVQKRVSCFPIYPYVFDQLRIPGNCSNRVFSSWGVDGRGGGEGETFCREILPYFCCHQDIFMLIYESYLQMAQALCIQVLLWYLPCLQASRFNRMQQLFVKKCARTNRMKQSVSSIIIQMKMLQGTHCKHYVPVLPHE